jgi:predicted NBD/HSP70 family sugar kinase
MRNKGRNIRHVRDDNRSLVLKLVCTGQCSSRIAVSRKTGLSKMTVSNIVTGLIRERWLQEGELLTNDNVGRNPVILRPDTESRRVIGVYISRDKVTVSSITLQAQISCSFTVPLNAASTARSLLDSILRSIKRIFDQEGKAAFAGIGVACIGPLDIGRGMLLSPPDFHGIENVPLRRFLEEKTGLPVRLDNDMNAAALAEMLYGKGIGCSDFLYIGLTNGIGSGVVLNGMLYTGAGGFAGELGHVSIDYNGPVCTCGNRGCLEVFASIPGLLQRAARESEADAAGALHGKRDIGFRDIVEAAEKQDPAASRIIKDVYAAVSTALTGAIHLLNPEQIFIGHESAQGGEVFARRLEEALNSRSLFGRNFPVRVSLSAFGDASPIIGSGVLFLETFFKGQS